MDILSIAMGSLSIWHLAIIGAIGLMLLSAFGSRRSSTQKYVIKEWFASETPNREGIYVNITGRSGGLISFVLSLVGIDPTVSLVVDRENVRFTVGSWTGFDSWVTPLEKLCSGHYGYSKPFWSTVLWIIIGVALLFTSFGQSITSFGQSKITFGLSLILILGAIAYYFLNKTLVLGLTYIGGGAMHSGDQFAFKRSVIEGKNIDEFAAERIVAIIEMITLGAEKPRALNVDGGARATASETLNRVADVQETAKQRALEAQARAQEAVQRRAHSAGAPRCPSCNALVAAESVFCGECGAKLG